MIYFILFIFSILIILSDTIILCVDLLLIEFVLLIVVDLFKKNKSYVVYLWIVSFVYVIISECIVSENDLIAMKNGILSVKMLFVGCNFFFLGYYLLPKNYALFNTKLSKRAIDKVLLYSFNIVLLLLYITLIYKSALNQLFSGRTASSFEYGPFTSFINSVGIALPSLLYWMLSITKKNVFPIKKYILFSFPIWLLILIQGNRFFMLFSVLPILFLSRLHERINLKSITILLFSLVLLLKVSVYMKSIRAYGLNKSSETIVTNTNHQFNGLKYIANKMSPEGVVKCHAYSLTYFENNNHLYGVQSLGFLYFFVPRSVWSNKPTLIGHWLIRFFEGGFSSGHSASFGFMGELYVDFGYFSFFFIIVIGLIYRSLELSFKDLLQRESFYAVPYSFIYPLVFFSVRSPMTGLITFIGVTCILIFVIVSVSSNIRKLCNN